jgi:hypothetical protein
MLDLTKEEAAALLCRAWRGLSAEAKLKVYIESDTSDAEEETLP